MCIIILGPDVDQVIAIYDHLTISVALRPIVPDRARPAVSTACSTKDTIQRAHDGVGIPQNVSAGLITNLEFDVIDAVAVIGTDIRIAGVGADRKRPGLGRNRLGGRGRNQRTVQTVQISVAF